MLIFAAVIAVAGAANASQPAQGAVTGLEWPLARPPHAHLCRGCEEVELSASPGTPVLAAGEGEVVFVGDDPPSRGQRILIRHSGGVISSYGEVAGPRVKVGERVTRGETIGVVGGPDGVMTARLRFGLRKPAGAALQVIDPNIHLARP